MEVATSSFHHWMIGSVSRKSWPHFDLPSLLAVPDVPVFQMHKIHCETPAMWSPSLQAVKYIQIPEKSHGAMVVSSFSRYWGYSLRKWKTMPPPPRLCPTSPDFTLLRPRVIINSTMMRALGGHSVLSFLVFVDSLSKLVQFFQFITCSWEIWETHPVFQWQIEASSCNASSHLWIKSPSFFSRKIPWSL
jgi:hypothetical protein